MKRRRLTDAERAAAQFDEAKPAGTLCEERGHDMERVQLRNIYARCTRCKHVITEEERQKRLFTNETKPSWPVHHPEILPLVQTMSDETKGPLSAAEAERVIRKQSIRFAGHVFQKGLIHCAACADWRVVPPGNGFRQTVYSGTAKDAKIGDCGKCGAPVVGEDPRHSPSPR